MRTAGLTLRAMVALGFVLLVSVSAQAGINLSTGLDSSDNLILTGNTPDGHWTVDQPGGGIAPAKVVAPGDAGYAFAWAPNGPNSNWITIDPTTVQNAPNIPYTYYRQFTLTSSDITWASIIGTWGIDDGGDLKLNGTTISTSPADYSATTPFSVPTGSGLFVVGLNTLTITMTFSDNVFEAVRLEGAVVAPEPSSLIAAASGVAFAIVARTRRRRKAA